MQEYDDVKIGSDRNFGFVFAAVFAALAIYGLIQGGTHWIAWGGISLAILGTALIKPILLHKPNRLWFRFGLILGAIIAPITMMAVYLLAVLPTGLLMKMFGKDPLQRFFDKDVESYWIEREEPPQSMKQQF